MLKSCARCKTDKAPDLFSKSRSRKDGRHPYCKACCKERRDEPEAKVKRLDYMRKYNKDRRDERRFEDRLKRYNKTKEQLVALLESQGKKCANTGCLDQISLATAHVDHDRKCCSGRSSCGECVRGLLCSSCNIGLGYFKDDSTKLRGIADYVERCYNVSRK